jgi:hypothetical protein
MSIAKSPTEKQVRARKGHNCLFSYGKQARACSRAEIVTVEENEFRLCAVHEKRLRKIVKDAKKAHRRERWAA